MASQCRRAGNRPNFKNASIQPQKTYNNRLNPAPPIFKRLPQLNAVTSVPPDQPPNRRQQKAVAEIIPDFNLHVNRQKSSALKGQSPRPHQMLNKVRNTNLRKAEEEIV
jgi:hypothetical protein